MSEKISYRALSEFEDLQDTSERPYKIFYNNNMGNKTFIINLPMFDLYRMSAVANEIYLGNELDAVAQRPLDITHANKLAGYILKGIVQAVISRAKKRKNFVPQAYYDIQSVMGTQPYIAIQPIVCNLRACERDGSDLRGRPLIALSSSDSREIAAYEVLLSQKHILWVIDGQHRRKAFELIFDFFEHVLTTGVYSTKKSFFPVESRTAAPDEILLWNECNEIARSECKIAAEVHLGLDQDEEKQLFHDLNNLGKRVEVSLALEFDKGNPINTFIQKDLIGKILSWPIAKKDILNWQDDIGSITRKDLVSINSRLILNKTNPNGATPALVNPKNDFAIAFWQQVQKIPHLGQPGAKLKTVAAQPVVLKALAKLAYDFSYGREKKLGLLDKFLNQIPTIDFSHNNIMWRFYKLSLEDRKKYNLETLAHYLPEGSGGAGDYNRDIGDIDGAGMMRFGAKHNDIYPIIGDMIRWSLNLPNRHKK